MFFAHFEPYTYTDLQHFLGKISILPQHRDKLRVEHLCNSLGKLPCYKLTITDRIDRDYVSQTKDQSKWQKFEYFHSQNKDAVKGKKEKAPTLVQTMFSPRDLLQERLDQIPE